MGSGGAIRAILVLLAIVAGVGLGRPAHARGYRHRKEFRKLVLPNGVDELLGDAITSDVVPRRFLVKLRPLTSVGATRSDAGVTSRAGKVLSRMRHKKSMKVVHEYARAFEGFSIQADNDGVVDSMLADLEDQYEVLSIFPVVWLPPPEVTFSEPNTSTLRGSYSARDASAPTTDTFTRLQAAGVERLDGDRVKVGLIDTGVDTSHPALRNKVTVGWDFVGNNFRAGAVTAPSGNFSDCAGHGTHVAGIIAGSYRSSGFNYSGVAPGVTLGAYKVFGCSGGTSSDIIVAALDRAVQDGMQIINLSVGDEGAWQGAVAEAVSRLSAMGILVVAAAGNAGSGGLFMSTSAASANSTIAVASIQSYAAPAVLKLRVNGSAGDFRGDVRAGYGNVTEVAGAVMRPTAAMVTAAGAGGILPGDGCTANCSLFGDVGGAVVLIGLDAGCSAVRRVANARGCGALGVMLYGNDSDIDAVNRVPLAGSPGSWPSLTNPFNLTVLVVSAATGRSLTDGYMKWLNRPAPPPPSPQPRSPSPTPSPPPRPSPPPPASNGAAVRQSAELTNGDSRGDPSSHDLQPPPLFPTDWSPQHHPQAPLPAPQGPPTLPPQPPTPPSGGQDAPMGVYPPAAAPTPLTGSHIPPPPPPPSPRPPRPPPSPPRAPPSPPAAPSSPTPPSRPTAPSPDGFRRRLQQSATPPLRIAEITGTLVSPFSSWGPSPDLRLKPTVAAPGGSILSSVPTNRMASGFAYLSGTSQAAPYVTGVLALAFEAGRAQNLNSTQLEAALVTTARPLREVLDSPTGIPSLPTASVLRVGAGVVDVAAMVTNLVECSMTRIEIGSSLAPGGRVSYQIDIQNRGTAPLQFQLQHIGAATVNASRLLTFNPNANWASNSTRQALPLDTALSQPAIEVSFNTSRLANLTSIPVSSLGRARFRVFFNLASNVRPSDQLFFSGYIALIPSTSTADDAWSDPALAAAARQPPLYLPYTGYTQPLSSLSVLQGPLPAGMTDALGNFAWYDTGYSVSNVTDRVDEPQDYDFFFPPSESSSPSPPPAPPAPPPPSPPNITFALSGPNASLPTIGLYLQRPPVAQQLLLYSYPSNRLRGTISFAQTLRKPANNSPLLISWRGTYIDLDRRKETQVSTGDYYMKIRLTRPNAIGESSSIVMVDEWTTPAFRLIRPGAYF